MSQDEQVVSIRLRRNNTGTPWGFRMQGGHEYGSPLFIQTVNPKSLSARQGLRVGDRLLAVGTTEANRMSHEQAKMEIIRSGNDLDLIVQRRPNQQGPDQPDARQLPKQTRQDAYEEPTEYRGYTNPNVQSRSFKILQESLSYSEANEEGMIAPTGNTPGESIVCKAYNEGRRRLEELSEINPRNFTTGGKSPYRYGYVNNSKDEEEIRLQMAMRKRAENPDASVASAKKYVGVDTDRPQGAPAPVDLAGSSVLAPAAAQQQYLHNAKQHYQPQPAVNGTSQNPPVQVQAQTSVVHQVEPKTKLSSVNYQFEEQYGHGKGGHGQVIQPNNRQKAVVSPQKSNDFIPKTDTVSSVAQDLDLKHTDHVENKELAITNEPRKRVRQRQPAHQAPQQVQATSSNKPEQANIVSNQPAQSTVATPAVVTQQSAPPVVNTDATDGAVVAKLKSEPQEIKSEPVTKAPEQVSIPAAQPGVSVTTQSPQPSTPVAAALHEQVCEPTSEVTEEAIVAEAKPRKTDIVVEPATKAEKPKSEVCPPESTESAPIVAEPEVKPSEKTPAQVEVIESSKPVEVQQPEQVAVVESKQETPADNQSVVVPVTPPQAEVVVEEPKAVVAVSEPQVVVEEPPKPAEPAQEIVAVTVSAEEPVQETVQVSVAEEKPQSVSVEAPADVSVSETASVEEVASFSITTDADVSTDAQSEIVLNADTDTNAEAAITIDFQADVGDVSNESSAVTVSVDEPAPVPTKTEEKTSPPKKLEQNTGKPARAKFVDSQGGVAAR